MNVSAYEHLPLEIQKDMALLADEHGVLDEKEINQEINRVLERRLKTGESLELSDVVQEAVIATEARIPEAFRYELFKFIATKIQ